MSSKYYGMCHRNIGRVANIRTRDGKVYSGKISRVTPTHVYLTPTGASINNQEEDALKGSKAVMSEEQVKGSEILFGFGIALAAIITLGFAAAVATPFFGFGRPFFRRPFVRRPFVGGRRFFGPGIY